MQVLRFKVQGVSGSGQLDTHGNTTLQNKVDAEPFSQSSNPAKKNHYDSDAYACCCYGS